MIFQFDPNKPYKYKNATEHLKELDRIDNEERRAKPLCTFITGIKGAEMFAHILRKSNKNNYGR